MTAPLAPGLARKVKKVKQNALKPTRTALKLVLRAKHLQVLDLQTESPELLTALTSLSTFYAENTPTARRQLRSTLEQRSLQVNQEYLSAAEGVLKVCCIAHFHVMHTEQGMHECMVQLGQGIETPAVQIQSVALAYR